MESRREQTAVDLRIKKEKAKRLVQLKTTNCNQTKTSNIFSVCLFSWWFALRLGLVTIILWRKGEWQKETLFPHCCSEHQSVSFPQLPVFSSLRRCAPAPRSSAFCIEWLDIWAGCTLLTTQWYQWTKNEVLKLCLNCWRVVSEVYLPALCRHRR